jgi:uncharacterized protein (TIGR02996 family)
MSRMTKKRKLEAVPTADRAELRRLLEAAKADHWDDGPRLALADWLEEHGGEADRARAEAIRLQLEADSGGIPWRLVVDQIRDRFVREWVGGGHRELFRNRLPWCERGLLVAGPAARAWDGPGVPDEAWHWVETVRPGSAKVRQLQPMLASPRMATVTRLDLEGAFSGPQGLRPTFEGIGPGLRSLAVSCAVGYIPFVARTLPSGLSELLLHVRYPPTTCPALEDLLTSSAVTTLESLSLGWASPDEAAAGLIAALPRLQRLHLQHLMPSTPLAALTGPGLRGLEVGLGEQSLAALARLQESACRDTLTSLDVCGGSPHGEVLPFRLPRLRRLALAECYLNGARMTALAEGGTLEGLSDLGLSHNAPGPDGLAALTTALGPGLRRLDLSMCGLGDAEARRLAEWKGLASVRVLLLVHNNLTDKGVRALAESPHAGSLEAISLDSNGPITSAGITALLRGTAGKRLAWLSMARIASDWPVAEPFEAARPSCLRELHVGWQGSRGRDQFARLKTALPDCVFGV